jgi:hypothetical protein
MPEQIDIVAKLEKIQRGNRRLNLILIGLVLVMLGLQVGRIFVLDSKVTHLVMRLHACESAKGVMVPLDYPNHVAEESDHGD